MCVRRRACVRQCVRACGGGVHKILPVEMATSWSVRLTHGSSRVASRLYHLTAVAFDERDEKRTCRGAFA